MKKILKKLPIHTSVFIGYLGITIIIILFITISIYFSTSSILIEQTNNGIITRCNDTNFRLAELIDKQLYTCQTITSNETLQQMIKEFTISDKLRQFELEKNINNLITNYWSNNLTISNIGIFVPNKIYNSSKSTSVYLDSIDYLYNQPWFKDIYTLPLSILFNAEKNISSSPADRDKSGFITIIEQIIDTNGVKLGYVMVNLSKERIYSDFMKNQTENYSTSYVLKNDGKIIISPNSSPIDFEKITRNKEIVKYQSGGTKKILLDGEKYLLSYSETNKQGWKCVDITPTKKLYPATKRIRDITFLSILFALILSLIMNKLLAKFTTRPIVHLSNTMKRFLNTNAKDKIENDYMNEIGVLNTTYNAMLDKIDVLMHEEKVYIEKQKQAEIKALQAQINPHFLYNTLDSISWNAYNNNMPQIGEMLNTLGKLYQFNLYKGLDVCTLEHETNHASLYMELQKKCFGNSFQYKIDIDDTLLKLYVPRFILQPLIENSIVHGFMGMKTNGMLSIKADININLIIEITDNGKGISSDMIKEINQKVYSSNRYGISNISERISLICGTQYDLHFDETYTFGTKIILTLPVAQNADCFNRKD